MWSAILQVAAPRRGAAGRDAALRTLAAGVNTGERASVSRLCLTHRGSAESLVAPRTGGTRMIRSTLALVSLALPLFAAGQGRPDLRAGLVASYPFDGDTVD